MSLHQLECSRQAERLQWQKRFGGDPAVLGSTMRLNGIAFTVVGITSHNFAGANVQVQDFRLPLSDEPLIYPDDNWLRDRENRCTGCMRGWLPAPAWARRRRR